jgi:hypothetical protein
MTDLEENDNTGVCLGTLQIHIDNIFDGGFIRNLHIPTVQDYAKDIRDNGWKIESVSFYQVGILLCVYRLSKLNCVTV